MVPPDSPSNPNIIHEFLISNPSHYESHPFDPYGVDFRNLGSYPSQSVNELPNIQCLGGRISRSYDLIQAPPMVDEQQLNHQNQKLSLSLGSRLLFPSSSQCSGERCYLASGEELQEKTRKSCDLSQYSTSSSLNQASYTCYGTDSPSLSIASSRYFKPTQSLLEELVSVNEIDLESTNKLYASKLSGLGHHGSLRFCSQLKAELCTNGLSLEKQELQATLGKLISLLEEVERRYEQYYQQLEQVVSSFESNAGLGSGKSYTALAISAMSGHFASLKDAILCQLYATRKKIMQDLPKLNTGLSQLGLFDKETNRHNRIALQQLGMMAGPTQTWRPIRGLPETSVMILRSWLFEHFLHPYPNDNEKLLLASQTGLSKNQVSNWFINARVRLWKPMIEEMYKEEFADSSEDSNL